MLTLFFTANTKAFACIFIAAFFLWLVLEFIHAAIQKYRAFTENRHGGYISVHHLKASREARVWDFINSFYYNHIHSNTCTDMIMLAVIMAVSVLGMVIGVCLM